MSVYVGSWKNLKVLKDAHAQLVSVPRERRERGNRLRALRPTQGSGDYTGIVCTTHAHVIHRFLRLAIPEDPTVGNTVATIGNTVGTRLVQNNYFTEMCSGSEAGSYSRRILAYHSTLGLTPVRGAGVGADALEVMNQSGFKKSTAPQNCQLIVDRYLLKNQVDGFVW